MTQATRARFIDVYEPLHAPVAQEGENLCGLAHHLFHRSTLQLQPTCCLHDLFTAEAARGKGVGRALINAVLPRAAETGLARVYWHTDGANQNAMALYDKLADKMDPVMYRKALR